MFNYKIIFRFFSLVFIAGIFFGLNNVLGVCINNMTEGSNSPYPGSNPSAGNCRSNALSGNDQRYNNQNPLAGTNTLIFLKMFNFNPTLNCNSTSVANIQNKMQNIGGNCSACIDGKAGNVTRTRLENSCLSAACPPPKEIPTLENNALKCNNYYTLDNGCCIAPNCTVGEKVPLVNSSCANGFTGDGEGCCIPYCELPKKPILNNNNCSDQPGYKYENGCCVPSGSPNVVERETKCNLSPGALNDTTVSCIEQEGSTPCCIDPQCRGQLAPGQIKPNLSFCATTSCAEPLKLLSGGDCSYIPGSGWSADGAGCCKQFSCPNPPISGTCSPGFTVGKTGAIDCCIAITNQCTGSKAQYGVLSGTSYACNDCGSGKIANVDHTKCVCDPAQGCCGIQLNTVVPFIGDCIEMSNEESAGTTTRVNALNAFPILMGSLSKILVTAILIFSFVMVVVGGVLITSGGIKQENYKSGIEIIQKVIIALALLGASGIILRLINPNFFG